MYNYTITASVSFFVRRHLFLKKEDETNTKSKYTLMMYT